MAISKRNAEDEALKAAFIAKKGVTKLPGFGHGAEKFQTKTKEPLPKKEQPVFQEIIYKPISMNPGPKPHLMWIPVDNLFVNKTYQRTISTRAGQKVIREIVEHFKWRLFSPLTVTEREEGGYWLIDGQHRAAAAKMRGIREVPVILLENMTIQEQAETFTGINKRRVSVNSYALHHAMVASGDEMALKIKAVCDAAGVIIPPYPKAVNAGLLPNESLAISAIKIGIKSFGPEAVTKALMQIRDAYPTTPGRLNREAIQHQLARNERRKHD